ncbi:MAG: bifunctional indole-3-glycerol-phosphate synthase TrpC/phosphoribosylanthranilate isomerase TrpF [Sphingomonas sp.]|uniref:bifunctional indole-3-glycerol-phosphate synthase TrpC/phosphoribosylanthranilate isomerase TrpF n=1 Tax=Sphingomonas sp. TaxID=28214 RepID=UPI00178E0F9F|nr:bifunctional indole-3-glycerol-phosphate synthase TrpC/phosphoribosylanthranilate isomerase TrpF [Sphingomonas sp.]MBA3667816.1 bifunctional indole-3-glycerol-phosphate synthase TrpC/phosphoribosylanthranilate isomerase TrpF [Sphingomonas sp.]
MVDVLDRIVARKRREVAARLSGPIEAVPTTRSLRAALARPGARFVMEVKRASPSGHRSGVSVEQAAAAYAPVADAISVLTDGPDFGGSLDDLRTVRVRFDGPILAKDFIVDPAQVSEARAAGADAVLCMMSVLDDAGATAVLAETERLQMDAIVEVHDEAELARALALGVAIVGINNRDLKTLKTDLAVTQRLAPLVPADVLVISESGISSRADVERLARHADAFLVGSALMAALDIAEAARALVHGRVKLCGLTRTEDVVLAAGAGATHAGFILVPGTPRHVGLEQARLLAASARELGLQPVGVFRDVAPREVAKVAEELRLGAVQLHGREGERDIGELRRDLHPETELWAVCRVGDDVQPARAGADRTLFDSDGGGTGRAFDWSRIERRDDLSAAFVAGGIGPVNAREASRLGAYGIDVGSGAEASPGIKDGAKVRALFDALRAGSRSDA